ncbi:MAG: CpaD family pilus assembly protein [Alphaproteobacteria bacterium]|nr:CpaD family pilus assembly protein [Alphaproteobacteria bacterium]
MAHGWWVPLLLLGVLISGCQHERPIISEATPQPAVRDKYPISVKPQQESMPLSPVLVGKKLGAADARQVTTFAESFLQNGHGPLAIILPRIPNTPQMTGQVQAINETLAERGVPDSRIEWRIVTPGAPAAASAAIAGHAGRPEPIVFSFTRYVAVAERECGTWEKDLGTYRDNQSWTNFGCAHQNNLAAMIVDPLDLKRPRALTPVDVDRRTVVIKAYREGKKTTSERGEEEKGAVSEVAK